ncbi:5-formyltetrahydrofolate cyclo-ligase [Paenarthrobacter sp. DKR-5]|uniref:5-formyltetrahydrofolate cyclo-ligase n=1 Tax=Paenarthrobacter sp. DKR-5 TaxID=2835535 RepID=UPI001BDC832D|nr:5-formyltetrahydrofolate cyclo-ligase [Paenarthrobacter sp. DKR-5]MBT1001003.1 5-formyltetrahydrofolate cyclo-ligase [Paenarthrobacter sp. DKR-5]
MHLKARARPLARARRAALSAENREASARGLAVQAAQWAGRLSAASASPDAAIAAFASGPLEPPTDALLVALHAAGHPVLLPVCEPGYGLSWVHWRPGTELRRSPLAPVLEPVGARHGLDVMDTVLGVLVPALAVDVHGNRLGQGGGYYDRFLGALAGLGRRPATAAVVYAEEVLPAGSFETTVLDMPVDGWITPSGWQEAAPQRV